MNYSYTPAASSAERAAQTARSQEASRQLLEAFQNPASPMCKQAMDATNAFTRTMLMEDSFVHKLLPAEPITPEELTEDMKERKPYKLVDMEPNSTGAMTIQFGTIPNTTVFDSQKYPVYMNRIITQRLTMDIVELMRYRYDIRQVLLDKQTKYIEMEKDRRFMDAVDTALYFTTQFGSFGVSGRVTPSQIRDFDGLTRENFVDSWKIMTSTPAHISPSVALCNTNTAMEFAKWYGDEMGGGTLAEDIIVNGLGERTFGGLNWITSIKHELLQDGRIYYFANPDFLGKHYVLEDLSLWVRNEAFMLSCMQWMSCGAAIGNLSGIAMANFDPRGLSTGGTGLYSANVSAA